MEYANQVWDPHHKYKIDTLEMVQRRAARWVANNNNNDPGTVTNILQSLKWHSLKDRRMEARLTLFYKGLHNQAAIHVPINRHRPTRSYTNQEYIPTSFNTDAHRVFPTEQRKTGIIYLSL